MTFDITADISRQFTRDGRKVLAIYDSGLDCKYPIAAWFENENASITLTKNGCCWNNSGSYSGSDIITRSEPLPLVTTFHNIYPTDSNSLKICENNRAYLTTLATLATIKITFDPNTGESAAETVWQKETAK